KSHQEKTVLLGGGRGHSSEPGQTGGPFGVPFDKPSIRDRPSSRVLKTSQKIRRPDRFFHLGRGSALRRGSRVLPRGGDLDSGRIWSERKHRRHQRKSPRPLPFRHGRPRHGPRGGENRRGWRDFG